MHFLPPSSSGPLWGIVFPGDYEPRQDLGHAVPSLGLWPWQVGPGTCCAQSWPVALAGGSWDMLCPVLACGPGRWVLGRSARDPFLRTTITFPLRLPLRQSSSTSGNHGNTWQKIKISSSVGISHSFLIQWKCNHFTPTGS